MLMIANSVVKVLTKRVAARLIGTLMSGSVSLACQHNLFVRTLPREVGRPMSVLISIVDRPGPCNLRLRCRNPG